MANNVSLAGHIEVGDNVWFGGLSAVHQFSRIGRNAFIGGGAIVVEDVIPFGSVVGNHAKLAGLNMVGLHLEGAAWGAGQLEALPAHQLTHELPPLRLGWQ